MANSIVHLMDFTLGPEETSIFNQPLHPVTFGSLVAEGPAQSSARSADCQPCLEFERKSYFNPVTTYASDNTLA